MQYEIASEFRYQTFTVEFSSNCGYMVQYRVKKNTHRVARMSHKSWREKWCPTQGQTKIWSQNGKLLPRRDFYLIRIVENVIRFYFLLRFASLNTFVCVCGLCVVVVASYATNTAFRTWISQSRGRGHNHLRQSDNNNYHIKNQFI